MRLAHFSLYAVLESVPRATTTPAATTTTIPADAGATPRPTAPRATDAAGNTSAAAAAEAAEARDSRKYRRRQDPTGALTKEAAAAAAVLGCVLLLSLLGPAAAAWCRGGDSSTKVTAEVTVVDPAPASGSSSGGVNTGAGAYASEPRTGGATVVGRPGGLLGGRVELAILA